MQQHIATMRTMAQQENLSSTCLERLEQVVRVVPKMQATIEFVAGSVRLSPVPSLVSNADEESYAKEKGAGLKA